mgnify:CR=1 FL=1
MTAIFAHRGAKRVAPENTLPAFAAALEMGVDGIELDVHLSRDGRLVVIHDETLDATTNGHGPVSALTAAELAALDAGSHFDPAIAHVGVPTLDEGMDLVDDRCVVNIEVKTADPLGGAAVEPLLDFLRTRQLFDQVIVSSFNPVSLIRLRSLESRVRLGLLHFRPLPVDLSTRFMSGLIGPDALHPFHALVDDAYMIWARAHGCPVNTWTVNDVEDARRLAGLGVATIMSDAPDEMMHSLRALRALEKE